MTSAAPKPAWVYDRDAEWAQVAAFAASTGGSPLGIVYGRRRQGKTWLLEALEEAVGAFRFTSARDESTPRAVARMGAELGQHLGVPPFAFADVDGALAAIGDLLRRRRLRVFVLDEVPYLIENAPEVPSVLQRILDASRRLESRIILCGSAFTVMRDLLQGSAPLRGRAQLALVVNPFDFRAAAGFWGLERSPLTALHVHAVLGGTPAYRDLAGSAPRRPADFEPWLRAAVLDPSRALFWEGPMLLAEEEAIGDRAVYHEILAVIAGGGSRLGQIAGELGRSSASLAPLLRVLESLALVDKVADPLRKNRFRYEIAEPMLRFHHAVLHPVALRRRFERRDRQAWVEGRERFGVHVLGPHFEALARTWTEHFAALLGDTDVVVGKSETHDPETRTAHEIDVVVVRARGRGPRPVLLAIGEAKASRRPIGEGQLGKLERKRGLLAAQGVDGAATARLLLFGMSGFTPALRAAARRRDDVELIDLERLYGGG